MSGAGSDPTVIRTLAVSAADVVAAVEARRQRDAAVVLRATPPFSGRMRARLHVESDADDDGPPSPVHVDPIALLDESAPSYPRPAETEDSLRDDPDTEYTVARHRERHADRIENWRARLPDHVRDQVNVTTESGEISLDLVVLGEGPE